MNGRMVVAVLVTAGVLVLGGAATWQVLRVSEEDARLRAAHPPGGAREGNGGLPSSTGPHPSGGAATTTPDTSTRGRGDVAATPLTPEEVRDLDADLAEAERAKVGKLIDDLLHEVDSGRSVRTRYLAGLLAWNLSKHPEGIAEVLKRLKETDLKPASAHTLILAVGGVASKEAREALLLWLGAPTMKPYEGFVLEALHQACIATREYMETFFRNFRRASAGPASPNEYTGFRAPDFDPDVVKATMARFSHGSPDLTSRAGSLLMGLITHPERDARLAPDVRKDLVKGLLDTLKTSDDAPQRTTAVQALRWVRDADVNAALWEAFHSEPADSIVRNTLAGAVAYQARTLEDVKKVFDSMKTESSSEARKAFIVGLPLSEWRDSSMRDAGAQQIEDWGKQERDGDVRLEAARALGPLFPEGASHLDWALHDLSPEVRAAAEDLKRSTIH